MAQNRWVKKWSYGYSGTDNSDVFLLTEELGLTEAEVEALTDEEAQEKMQPIIWDEAVQQVEAYCRPAKEGEVDWQTISSSDD